MNRSLALAVAGMVATAPTFAQGPGTGPMAFGPGMTMFEKFDGDGDGRIALDEFRAGHQERFTAIDVDRDGKITLQEFEAAPRPNPSRVQRMFQRVDGNGDGTLSEQEFAQHAASKFERIDANGDDVVTMEEVQQSRTRMRGDGQGPGTGPGQGPAR